MYNKLTNLKHKIGNTVYFSLLLKTQLKKISLKYNIHSKRYKY